MTRYLRRLVRLDPVTRKKLVAFRQIKRGYISLIIILTLILLSFAAELLVNNRALVVSYGGSLYFPTYGAIIPGHTFGLDYDYETNYRQLQQRMQEHGEQGFVIMPLIPYSAFENDLREGVYPPTPPSLQDRHYLGTDTTGRDVLARLVYGFRISILFSLVIVLGEYVIGSIMGFLMGYYGGRFDLVMQRLIEIWVNVPFLYVVIIISSIITPNFWLLILIMLLFGWVSMTTYMRSAAYKEKARDYVLAAKSIGVKDRRIILHEIFPNTLSIMITFLPFSISAGIVALTTLDFLGFGLPPPTPSWGELLSQGIANLHAVWIGSSVVVAMIVILTMVTFVGEAMREAFDPRKYTVYE